MWGLHAYTRNINPGGAGWLCDREKWSLWAMRGRMVPEEPIFLLKLYLNALITPNIGFHYDVPMHMNAF